MVTVKGRITHDADHGEEELLWDKILKKIKKSFRSIS